MHLTIYKKGIIMQKNFKPLTVEFNNGELVLVRHKMEIVSETIGSSTDRKAIGEMVRNLGFKTVKFSQEALDYIDADLKAIKEAKAQAKAEKKAERLAKKQANVIAKQERIVARQQLREAKAQAKAQRIADRAIAKQAKADAKAQRIADRAIAKQAKADAKAAKLAAKQLAKQSPKEIVEQAVELMAA